VTNAVPAAHRAHNSIRTSSSRPSPDPDGTDWRRRISPGQATTITDFLSGTHRLRRKGPFSGPGSSGRFRLNRIAISKNLIRLCRQDQGVSPARIIRGSPGFAGYGRCCRPMGPGQRYDVAAAASDGAVCGSRAVRMRRNHPPVRRLSCRQYISCLKQVSAPRQPNAGGGFRGSIGRNLGSGQARNGIFTSKNAVPTRRGW